MGRWTGKAPIFPTSAGALPGFDVPLYSAAAALGTSPALRPMRVATPIP